MSNRAFEFRSLFSFKKRDLDYVFNHKIISSKQFGAYFISSLIPNFNELEQQSSGEDVPRFCLVISRKVGNAVQRNLLRRRLKYLFFTEQFYSFPYFSALVCSKKLAELSFADLKVYLQLCFSKIRQRSLIEL